MTLSEPTGGAVGADLLALLRSDFDVAIFAQFRIYETHTRRTFARIAPNPAADNHTCLFRRRERQERSAPRDRRGEQARGDLSVSDDGRLILR